MTKERSRILVTHQYFVMRYNLLLLGLAAQMLESFLACKISPSLTSRGTPFPARLLDLYLPLFGECL